MARRGEQTVKKTYNLPPRLLARVRRLLKVRTETEAIVRSLEQVAYMDDVERAVRKAGGQIPDYRPLR